MGRTYRFRGSRYHGHGKKARRGAGKRGGRGKAGSFKHRKIWIRKTFGNDYFGKHGFKRHPSLTRRARTINVGEVSERWGAAGKTVKVDLTALGYGKLLGGGHVDSKLVITVASAVPGAVVKIEEAGGSVETTAGQTGTEPEKER